MSEKNSNIYIGQVASPPTKFEVGEMGGRTRTIVGTVALATDDFDADGDTVRLAKLPSNARVFSIKIANQDMGTSNDVDIGLSADAGALIDEDEFAVQIDAEFDAETGLTEYFGYGLTDPDVIQAEKTLWERAGLTSDTGLKYDIVMFQTATVTEAAANLSFIIQYTVD